MKIVTYHYIRTKSKNFPYFNFIEKKKFIKQLNFFEKTFGIIKKEKEIFTKNNKVLLTFDDGLKEHLHVAKILKKRKILGLFFTPTYNLINSNYFLNVHKAHLILGKVKPLKAYEELIKFFDSRKFFIKKDMLNTRFKSVYKSHSDDKYKKKFKKIINYTKNVKHKSEALDYLMRKFKINVKPSNFYLSIKDLKFMSKIGMIIGSHSNKHILMSSQSYKEQNKEINVSKKFLEKAIKKKIYYFCYPYGVKMSFNKNTKKLLKKNGFKFSFTFFKRESNLNDFKKKPLEIPRLDCNQF